MQISKNYLTLKCINLFFWELGVNIFLFFRVYKLFLLFCSFVLYIWKPVHYTYMLLLMGCLNLRILILLLVWKKFHHQAFKCFFRTIFKRFSYLYFGNYGSINLQVWDFCYYLSPHPLPLSLFPFLYDIRWLGAHIIFLS